MGRIDDGSQRAYINESETDEDDLDKLGDFYPEDMLTIVLNEKSEMVRNFIINYLIIVLFIQSLHEDAPEEPIFMRGTYFVNVEAGSTPDTDHFLIDFFILDPNYKVIFSRRGKEDGLFGFNSTMPGQYSFVFSNMGDRVYKKTVTLAIHPGYEYDDVEVKKE